MNAPASAGAPVLAGACCGWPLKAAVVSIGASSAVAEVLAPAAGLTLAYQSVVLVLINAFFSFSTGLRSYLFYSTGRLHWHSSLRQTVRREDLV